MTSRLFPWVAMLVITSAGAQSLTAQAPATIEVVVVHDTLPVAGATVRSGVAAAFTDRDGLARLSLPPGPYQITVAMLGYGPDTVSITLRSGQDTSIRVSLQELPTELEVITVSSARGDRLVSDEPTRVEVVSREEMSEKTATTPGNVTMVLNETSGVRIQTTAPSTGGANVRVQGMRGHFTQILSDGLPLFGLTTEGLGLLQIPPVDLQQAEVLKGAASALYGTTALGGVVNLISRRPADADELLLNVTSNQAGDALIWRARKLSPAWGYTFIGGVHGQHWGAPQNADWIDFPSYERAEARPRVFWSSPAGGTLLLTTGGTVEDRDGGTPSGTVLPSGLPYAQKVRTGRGDAGAVASLPWGPRLTVSLRGSLTQEWQTKVLGGTRQRARRNTLFDESALTVTAGSHSIVIGGAIQRDSYSALDLQQLSYNLVTPAVFVQETWLPTPRFGLTSSARLDASNQYGTFLSPRVSAILHPWHEWTVRLSAGSGAYLPTPFTEDTEEIDFARLRPLSGLVAERGRSGGMDLSGKVGPIEVNATVYGSVVDHPVALRPVAVADTLVEFVNAGAPTRTIGVEGTLRYRNDAFTCTAFYAGIHATELDVDAGERRGVPLTPRHAGGVDLAWETEDGDRFGLEGFYTGTQTLAVDPYRAVSHPYLLLGALLQHRVGRVLVFLNGENLTNVHQTGYDPLRLPAAAPGGRWTTDAWAPLEGRVVNLGARIRL